MAKVPSRVQIPAALRKKSVSTATDAGTRNIRANNTINSGVFEPTKLKRRGGRALCAYSAASAAAAVVWLVFCSPARGSCTGFSMMAAIRPIKAMPQEVMNSGEKAEA